MCPLISTGWVSTKYDHVAVGLPHDGRRTQFPDQGAAEGAFAPGAAYVARWRGDKGGSAPNSRASRPAAGWWAEHGDWWAMPQATSPRAPGKAIYFAAKSGRMCAETDRCGQRQPQHESYEKISRFILKKWESPVRRQPTKVFGKFLRHFYRNYRRQRKAFVEMWVYKDVQRPSPSKRIPRTKRVGD